MAELKQLVIDRAKWGQRRLLNNDGTMCCLGFICKLEGLSDAEIGTNAMPWGLPTDVRGRIPSLVSPTNETLDHLVNLAAEINDNVQLPPSVKEQMLKKLLFALGYAVRFEGPLPANHHGEVS